MYWQLSNTRAEVDIGVLEEAALARAQSTIQNVMDEAKVSQADLARKMQCNRSFISRMLSGSHNLTIKTMARSLASCGYEVRFEPVPIVWNWVKLPMPNEVEEEVPANAGTTMLLLADRLHSSAHVS